MRYVVFQFSPSRGTLPSISIFSKCASAMSSAERWCADVLVLNDRGWNME
jgi:hypothetical protein